MSDKSEKYEDEIEEILKDSGDLPEPPKALAQPQNPIFEDLKILDCAKFRAKVWACFPFKIDNCICSNGYFVFCHEIPVVCLVGTSCIFGNISCVFPGKEVTIVSKQHGWLFK